MQNRFNTPQRSTLNRINYENQPPMRHYYQSHQSNRYDTIIDYKAKAFELMQTLSELEIKDKESQRTVFYLQKELESIHKILHDFLSEFGFNSLSEFKTKFLLLTQEIAQAKKQSERPLEKDQRITEEYDKILAEYKLIIKAQQEKMMKCQSKWKSHEASLFEQCQKLTKKQQILSQAIEQITAKHDKQKEMMSQNHEFQIQKLHSQISQLKSELSLKHKESEQRLKTKQEEAKAKENLAKLFEQNMQMKQDLDMLKAEFRELLIEKQSIEEKHEKLKKKYKNEIEHFEMIEKEVEEKLIEVQKQITFYKEERESNIQLIEKLQHQNQVLKASAHQHEDEFSFGGYCNAETQTDSSGSGQDVAMNAECYEISIKSLLEENSRLKRTLVLLDKTKRGEEIPAEAQLELKLLKGLSESPYSRSKRQERETERESQQSPKFRVLEGLEQESTQQNDIE